MQYANDQNSKDLELDREIKLLLVLWACLIAIDSQGALPDSVFRDTTSTTVRLDDVIVKASRFDSRVRTIPGSVQLLNKEKFQRTEIANLSEVVNSIPGVYMQSGGFQTSRLIIRGIGSRNPYGSGRIRAFYDDIPLSSGDGTTVIEDIEPIFIEKAEIIKGPNSAWYGAGIGGSIRFFSQSNVKKTAIQIFSGAGSYGSYKIGGIAKVPIQNGFLNAGFSKVTSDGYRQNSNYYRNSFFLSGAIGKGFKINYLFHASDVNAHMPSSIDENAFFSNPQLAAGNWLKAKGYKAYKRFLGGIRAEKKFGTNIVNFLCISGGLNNPYELRPFNILDDNSRTLSISENIKITYPFNTFLIGGEWLQENYSWRILQNQSLKEQQRAMEKRDHANAYVSLRSLVFSPFLLSFSLNVNKTRYSIHDLYSVDSVDYSGKTRDRYTLSPRLGISVPLLSNVTFYGSYGNGFSNPTVEESLNSEGVLNSNLKPEQGWGFDLGIRAYLVHKSLWMDITYYNIQLKDLLVTKRLSEELFSGENAGNASLQGFELLAQYHPIHRLRANLSLQRSINKFKSFVGENDYSGNKLPGIPDFTVNSDIEVSIVEQLILTVDLNYYGKQYMNDDNSRVSKAWKTLDTKIANSFKLYKCLFEIQIGVKNLFDEQYASMILVNAPSLGSNPPRYYYPGLPRNYFFSLKLDF